MPPAVELWSALLRAQAALVPVLDRELQSATRLPLTWYDVLLELYHAPGRQLRMSDLGERAVISRTRTSRVVDELVAAGLVERQPNPDDGRSALAVLTAAGRSRFRRAAPVYLAAIERHVGAALSDSEATRGAAILTKLLAG